MKTFKEIQTLLITNHTPDELLTVEIDSDGSYTSINVPDYINELLYKLDDESINLWESDFMNDLKYSVEQDGHDGWKVIEY